MFTLKNGFLMDLKNFNTLCKLIVSFSAENEFDFLEFAAKIPHYDLGNFNSLIEYVFCSVFANYSSQKSLLCVSNMDGLIKSEQVLLFCFSQIVCCLPGKLSYVRATLGMNQFISLLLIMSTLPADCFGSKSNEEKLKVAIWKILTQLGSKKKFQVNFNNFMWPILAGLNSKRSKVRISLLGFCENVMLHKFGDVGDCILQEIVELKQEIAADRTWLKNLMQKFSEMPSVVTTLINVLENEKSDICGKISVPVLIYGIWNEKILVFLSNLLKNEVKKKRLCNESICCEIAKGINDCNFDMFLESFLIGLDKESPVFLVEAFLAVISPDLFKALSISTQHELFSRLIFLRKDAAKLPTVKRVVDNLPLNSKMLHKCLGLPEYDTNAKPRRSRVDSFCAASTNLDQIRLFLHFACDRNFSPQDAKEVIGTVNALILHLERLHVIDNSDPEMEHVMVFAVGVLSNFFSRYSMTEEILDTDLMLSLIRRFDDVNIKGQCFELVITQYEHVCQNAHFDSHERAVKIFTAICDALATREDEFSFRLILSSVRKLLIPLIDSAQEKPFILRNFLQHFVEAVTTQPSHRQILLIDTCIGHPKLDQGGYFWQLVLHIFTKSSNSSEVETSISVVSQMCEKYSLKTSLTLLSKLLTACEYFLNGRIEELQSYQLTSLKKLPRKVQRLTAIQILSLVPVVVHSNQFVFELTNVRLQNDTSHNHCFRGVLSQLFTLQTCETLKNVRQESASPNSKVKLEAEFAKTVGLKLKETVAAADVLFDDALFFEVFSELLSSAKHVEVQRSLQFLNIRISRPGSQFLEGLDATQIDYLYDLLLTHILHENDRICQYVLVTLIKIMKVCPSKVGLLTEKAIQLMDLKGSVCNIRVQVCALIAEVIRSVKQAFLPYLPNVAHFVLDIKSCKTFANKMLFDSVLLCLLTMFDNIAELLSPFLAKITKFLIDLSDCEEEFKLKKESAAVIEHLVSLKMRVVAPMFITVCESVFKDCEMTTMFLKKIEKMTEIVKLHLDKNNRSELELNQTKITQVLTMFLSLREFIFESRNVSAATKATDKESNVPENETSVAGEKRKKRKCEVFAEKRRKVQLQMDAQAEKFLNSDEFKEAEMKCFEPFIEFVLKNSESSVRQMLLKTFNWATSDDENTGRRQVTFFHLLKMLSIRLKGLMLLFIPTYVSSLKERLSVEPTQEEKFTSSEILFSNRNILECVTNVMSHDINGIFTTPEFVSTFMPLVANQWKFFLDSKAFDELSLEVICPCTSQMMLACQDADAKNVVHRQILGLGRESNSRLRRAAMVAIQSIANRLLEEYSMYYPEAVPVLAELKEDVNPEIEAECDNTLRTIEKVVGEAVYEHFPKIE